MGHEQPNDIFTVRIAAWVLLWQDTSLLDKLLPLLFVPAARM